RDRLASCSWLQRNEVEPPVNDAESWVQMPLAKHGASRFDSLIWPQGEQHSCLFVQPGTSNPCKYTNYRRHRVRSHIYSHFGYKPFLCKGACGKADCSLSFADNVLLSDHLRRRVIPRAKCEICGAMIALLNYKRHLMLVHSTPQTTTDSNPVHQSSHNQWLTIGDLDEHETVYKPDEYNPVDHAVHDSPPL
ncbi:hypothetical protein CPB86DRAFT_695254, partial [Serendipita vermifera]